jgi:hypothetical protein
MPDPVITFAKGTQNKALIFSQIQTLELLGERFGFNARLSEVIAALRKEAQA